MFRKQRSKRGGGSAGSAGQPVSPVSLNSFAGDWPLLTRLDPRMVSVFGEAVVHQAPEAPVPAFLVLQGSALFHFQASGRPWTECFHAIRPSSDTRAPPAQGPYTARLRRAWLLHDCHIVPVVEADHAGKPDCVVSHYPHALDLRHRTAPPTRLLLRTAAARDEWAAALMETQSVAVPFPVGAAAATEDAVVRRIAAAEEVMRAQALEALAAATAERRRALDVLMGDYVEEAHAREQQESHAAAEAARAEELARQLAQAQAQAEALQAQLQAQRRVTQDCGTQCEAEDGGPVQEQTPLPEEGQSDLPTPLAAPVKPPPPSPPRMSPSAAQRAVWPAATRRELSF